MLLVCTLIETQLRWVFDFELLCLARALRVEPNELWPPKDKIHRMLEDFLSGFHRKLSESNRNLSATAVSCHCVSFPDTAVIRFDASPVFP